MSDDFNDYRKATEDFVSKVRDAMYPNTAHFTVRLLVDVYVPSIEEWRSLGSPDADQLVQRFVKKAKSPRL